MKRTEIKYGKIIVIDSGEISVDGIKIGTVLQDIKFGYHPAIKLVIPSKHIIEWFELDTDNLVDKIFEEVGKTFNKTVKV